MAGYIQGLLGNAREALGNPSWQKGKPYRDALIGLLGGDLAPLQALNAPTPVDPNEALNVATAFAPGPMGLLGHTVWHGSPHIFEKFDPSKVGTGEGNQAFGVGAAYLAGDKSVGTHYRDVLTGGTVKPKDGVLVEPEVIEAINGEISRGRTLGDILRLNEQYVKHAPDSIMAKMHDAVSSGKIEQTGALYKVDIPDEIIPHMLDWDKPLTGQHPVVQNALQKLGINIPSSEAINAAVATRDDLFKKYIEATRDGRMFDIAPAKEAYQKARTAVDALNSNASKTGEDAYRMLGIRDSIGSNDISSIDHILQEMNNNQFTATSNLHKHGVQGIKYLDGNSRASGTGAYNFVPFNPDHLRILERNGVPTGQQPWKPEELRGLIGGF